MQPLREDAIRSSFVNTTVRERAQAALPDLAAVPWERLDYLGWRDPKRDQLAYVVVEAEGELIGLMLRTQPPSPMRRRMMCAWCQDVTIADPAVLYVARRAGAAGRKGDTIGTPICADFRCSANVRRPPSLTELSGGGDEARRLWVDERVRQLRERVSAFAREVARTA